MPTDAELAAAAETALAEALAGPRRVQGDGGVSVEQHDLNALIAAAKYHSSKAAAAAASSGTSPGLGLRFVKLRPPGSV